MLKPPQTFPHGRRLASQPSTPQPPHTHTYTRRSQIAQAFLGPPHVPCQDSISKKKKKGLLSVTSSPSPSTSDWMGISPDKALAPPPMWSQSQSPPLIGHLLPGLRPQLSALSPAPALALARHPTAFPQSPFPQHHPQPGPSPAPRRPRTAEGLLELLGQLLDDAVALHVVDVLVLRLAGDLLQRGLVHAAHADGEQLDAAGPGPRRHVPHAVLGPPVRHHDDHLRRRGGTCESLASLPTLGGPLGPPAAPPAPPTPQDG